MTAAERTSTSRDFEEDSEEEREFNEKRYDKLLDLLEGNLSAEITTAAHIIKIKPEEFCEAEDGCLEVEIATVTPDGVVPYKFNYHINHSGGVVGIGVDGEAVAKDFGIPGGGRIGFFTDWPKLSQDECPDLDFGKLSEFILQQAAIGEVTFEISEA